MDCAIACRVFLGMRYVQKVTPKMFSVPGNESDPIAVYKLFAGKRLAEMNSDASPFYLAVNSLKKLESLSNKAWFKIAPASINKLNSIMKSMAEKAGLTTKFTDHSGRKTMMQTLVNRNFPLTDIIPLSGHKNLQSVTHYSTVNETQQMEMSRTLSSVATGNLSHLCNFTTRNSGVCQFNRRLKFRRRQTNTKWKNNMPSWRCFQTQR